MSQLASFIFPTIVSLPLGYDCTFPLDIHRITDRLAVPEADLRVTMRRYFEGSIIDESEQRLRFEGGKLVSGKAEPAVWRDASERGEAHPSYAEVAVNAVGDAPVFTNRFAVSNYSIYTKPGKKAFFSDNAYKYGSPPIISMMAKLGRFVEGYPAIHLDTQRDCGETLLLINPYRRPVLVKVDSSDGRNPLKLRVPPQSVRPVPLIQFLRDGETQWLDRIQLTANNRLITFHVRHSLADPTIVSDHEHLDPFRAERTHLPASEAARISIASALRRLRRAVVSVGN
jgi:hypothetical protein